MSDSKLKKETDEKLTRKKTVKKKVAKKGAARKKVVQRKSVRKKAAAKKRAAPSGKRTLPTINPRDRYEMIAKMAYFRAEKRDFEPGWEQHDWLESEKLVDEMLRKA